MDFRLQPMARHCKLITVFAVTASALLFTGCASTPPVNSFRENFGEPSLAAYKQAFPRTFKVWSPSVHQHMLTLKYACPMRGANVSPAIAWRNIPKGSTNLYLDIVDGFCTWGCNKNDKAIHWVLDFPMTVMRRGGVISPTGIKVGAAKSKSLKQYTYANAMGKRDYLGMCSPVGQPHAWAIRMVAYKMQNGKVVVTGKTQSVPWLFPRSGLGALSQVVLLIIMYIKFQTS